MAEDEALGRLREHLDRGAQMVTRAGAGGHQRASAPGAGDPVHAAELRRGDSGVGKGGARGEPPAYLEGAHDLDPVVVRDLLEDARVEVRQRLHQLVPLAVVPHAADLAVDQPIGSRRLTLSVAGDQDSLAPVTWRDGVPRRGSCYGLLQDSLEPLARPAAFEGVVGVLEERVAVAEDDPPAARGAQLLSQAPRQLFPGVVGVGGDQAALVAGQRTKKLRGEARSCAVRHRDNGLDANSA